MLGATSEALPHISFEDGDSDTRVVTARRRLPGSSHYEVSTEPCDRELLLLDGRVHETERFDPGDDVGVGQALDEVGAHGTSVPI